jgi:hypothetical protein
MSIRVSVTLYSRYNISYLREDITLMQSEGAPARSRILLVQNSQGILVKFDVGVSHKFLQEN